MPELLHFYPSNDAGQKELAGYTALVSVLRKYLI